MGTGNDEWGSYGASYKDFWEFTPATPSLTFSVSSTNINCYGQCTGTATVTVTNGTLPYTYSWLPDGGANALATGLCAGTYSVLVSDAVGSTATNSVAITQPAELAATATVTPSGCVSNATADVTGGTPGYTYNWSPSGQTSQTATGLVSGIYMVTVTDANGCSNSTEVSITLNPFSVAPAIASNPVCPGSTLSLTTNAVAGATYHWTGPNGFTSTQQNPTIPNFALAMIGTYSLTTTVGACTSAAATTTANFVANELIDIGSNSSICQGYTLALYAPSIASATYNWTGPNGFTSDQQNPVIPNATPAADGTYSLTVTAGSCTFPVSTTSVSVIPVPAGTPSITVTHSPADCKTYYFSYSGSVLTDANWNFGDGTFQPVSGNTAIHAFSSNGTYLVSLTGTALPTYCVIGINVTVDDVPTPDFTYAISNPCDITAGINLNITKYNSNFRYFWSINKTTQIMKAPDAVYTTGLQTGANTIMLFCENTATHCMSTNSKIIYMGAPGASFTTNANLCTGDLLSVGGVKSGGDAYAWEITGAATYSVSGSIPSYVFATAGTYQVKLTITKGTCTNTYSTTATVSAPPVATFTLSTGTCNNGAVTVNLPANSGGVTSYTLDYGDGTILTGTNYTSGFQTAHTYANSNTYQIKFTVHNGACSKTSSQSITINNQSAITILAHPYLCSGTSVNMEGTVNNIPANAGTLSYNWSGPNSFTSSQPTTTTTAGGTYTLNITSDGACAINLTKTKTLTALATPTATIVGTPAKISCSQTTGTAVLEIATGLVKQGYYLNGSYTAAVPSATASVTVAVTGLVAGDNYITIANGLDNKSCSGTILVHIEQDLPLVNLNITQPLTCSGTGTVTIAPSSGTGHVYASIAYPQTPLVPTNNNYLLAPGSYVAEVIDQNCKVTEHFNIVAPVINLSLSNNNPGTCSVGVNETIIAQFSPSTVTGTYTYSWTGVPAISPGNVSNALLPVGNYTVDVSSSGCTSSINFKVKPLPPVTAALDIKTPKCFGDPAEITALASGGDGNYSYSWTNGATTQTITLLASALLPAIGSVTVTDASGCEGASATYTVNPATEIVLQSCTPPGVGAENSIHIDGCGLSVCLHGGNPSYNFEWYRAGTTSYILDRQFVVNSSGVLATKSGAKDAYGNDIFDPVPVPTTSVDVTSNLYKNSDGDFTTYYYPYWNFTVSPAVPILNNDLVPLPYSVTEKIINSNSEIYVTAYSGGESNTTSTAPFITGTYVLYVTDANGCKKRFDIGTLDFTQPMSTPAFTFVWGLNPKPDPEIPEDQKVDPVLADNMADAANEMLNEADQCMANQSKQMGDQLETDCHNLETFRDVFSMTYEIKEGHYTLYYYDRAGQLTKTVPPEGVEVFSSAQINAIKTFRKGGAAPSDYDPPHRMKTTYQYNSLTQLISQNTPDGGTSNFIYDGKSRLRFSQNAKQLTAGTYSYTKYDELGRIIEVGESSNMGALIFSTPSVSTNLTNANDAAFPSTDNAQITHTVYSDPAADATYYGKPQRYLQNRVSYVYTDEDGNPGTVNDMSYTYYSYDSHGNVEWLVQQDPVLGKNFIAYDYDLVSGKVLKVSYNENRMDRFFHKYSYDAENRLTKAETSRDGVLWDADAAYAYYDHGPLKRNVIGEDHVQGLDYIYTIQGWLKSINTPNLNPAMDPGADNGTPAADWQTNKVAQDRFGMILNYYRGDYTRTGTGAPSFLNSAFPASIIPTNIDNLYASAGTNAPDLYNGNISSWMQSQLNASKQPQDARADLYKHDVLNRLKQSISKDMNGASWDDMGTGGNAFKTSYAYDANENLLSLARYDETGALMDNLGYAYDGAIGADPLNNNRLSSLAEGTGVNTADGRQDLEDTHYYTYDGIGNLISDAGKERLNLGSGYNLYDVAKTMSWTVYGKVKEINTTITVPSGLPRKERIRYAYDASGNRTKKEVWRDKGTFNETEDDDEIVATYYVRDAQGNIMAVYNREFDVNDNLFKYKLAEQPIYGSDRIGENVKEVTLATAATASVLAMPGDGIKTVSEYQNWITSTNKTQLFPGGTTDQLCQCKVKSLGGTNYTTIGTAAEFLGVADNGVAVAENLKGELQFYVVLAKKYLGNNDACLIYDKDGKLMKGTENIGKINADSKPIVINISGSNKYVVVTLSNTKVPVYHVVDMDATGYGTVTAAGEVTAADQPMVDYSSIIPYAYAPKHGWHFTALEDHIAGRSIVYNTRYKVNPADTKRGTTEVVAYEFGTDISQTPQEHVLYSIDGCGITQEGELQMSPKGDKLLWFQYDKNVSGFNFRNADIYSMQLGSDKITVNDLEVTYNHISSAGNYGKGMAEFMKNNNDILYSQRGVYKEGAGATQYAKNVWKYEKLTSANTAINPFAPDITYLFSEIKRGVDGNYYMPNMGTPADKVHSYSGTAFNTDVNLNEAGYELASSLPTQVYKTFADPAQIPTAYDRAIGKKQYEIQDHQKNVRVLISDEKLVADVNSDNVINSGDIFTPSILSFSDYFPMGGMEMPGRKFCAKESKFGFQGQLKVDEVYGEGNLYSYKYRESDARKGGDFWSVDPLAAKYPECSPYAFSQRRVIDAIELEGLEILNYKTPYRLQITNTKISIVRSWSEDWEENNQMAKTAATLSGGLSGSSLTGVTKSLPNVARINTETGDYFTSTPLDEQVQKFYGLDDPLNQYKPEASDASSNSTDGMAADQQKGAMCVRTNTNKAVASRTGAIADFITKWMTSLFGSNNIGQSLKAQQDVNTIIDAYKQAYKFVERAINFDEFAKQNPNWTQNQIDKYKADIVNFVVDYKLPNEQSSTYNQQVTEAGLNVIQLYKDEGADTQKKLATE